MTPYDFSDVTALFDAEEASGSALLDVSGNENDLPDTLGVPGGITGIIGDGRGDLRSGSEHFTLNFSAGDAWDIRGVTSCTWAGWVKVLNTEQPYFFSIHDPASESRQALSLIVRSLVDTTPGPLVQMADGITSFNTKDVKVNAAVTLQLDVWQFIAGGYDAVRNKVFGAWGVAPGEFYYNETDGFAAGFGYSGSGAVTRVGHWNAEAGTAEIHIDHSMWFKGRALTQSELAIVWNNHQALPFDQLILRDPGVLNFREPYVVVELEQDQCRLLYGESPCTAALGTTGTRKCYNTRLTCQDTENYDSSTMLKDTSASAKDVKPQGWDVSTTGEVEASFDIGSDDVTPLGSFFKPDGMKLFIVGSTSDRILQYALSTPWDVSTAGLLEEEFAVPGSASPNGMFFKPDGLKLFEVGGTVDEVAQFPLTDAWDLSTVGVVEATFDVSSEDTNPVSIFFKSDGTKLFVLGAFNRKVFQYPLSTAWDISTAGLVEEEFTPIPIDTNPTGIAFKFDGSKLYFVGASTDTVHQFPLGTAWDLSTVGLFEATFVFTSEDTEPHSVFLKSDDGLKLYMVGNVSDTIHQYPLGDTVGNDGTIDGAVHVPAHVFGFGQALSFDGVDDSVEVPDPSDRYGFVGTASFTIEFVLDPETIPNSLAQLFDKEFTDGGGDQGWRIFLRRSDTSLVFERLRDGAVDTVSAPVLLLEARFWSAVYDGTDLILYEEGVEKARTTSAKLLLLPAPAEDLVIGNTSVGGTTKPYHGSIDEVRTWSVARTKAEIIERMVLPISGEETGLVSYFPLDDNPPSVATRTLRFTKPQVSTPRDLYLLPLLVDISTASTRINPGGGSRDRGVLGDRASVDIGFKDALGSDRVVDKYRTERISGTAQTDEGGYGPLERGSFWAKWRARNLFFQNRRLRILEGFIGQKLRDMRRRDYFVDQLRGPDADGRTVIRAKDVLKLADDDRAQAPGATPGELSAALTIGETTSFQATGALIADYPDEPGLVCIGTEVIEYQTRTQATVDNVQFNTLTRGERGTEAAAHDAEDRVQRCLEFVNVLPWKLAEDLLVNFGNIPAEFIPTADWDAEGEVWLVQFTLSAVITEPTSVAKLLAEITQQAQFFIWWDEYTQTIKLKALRPPTEDPVALNEVSHLIAGTSTIKEHPNQRLSQVWVFFTQKDPTKRLDDETNYSRVRIRADLEAEGPAQYGEARISKIFSRWLETEGQVSQMTRRTLDRYRDNPRTLKVRVDAKDRVALRVGEVADILMRTVLDDRGLEVSTRWQIISAREDPPGEAVSLELLEFEFTGRFAFYMEDAAPIFSNATDQEKKSGAWYSDDLGKFPDGTDGYQYQ